MLCLLFAAAVLIIMPHDAAYGDRVWLTRMAAHPARRLPVQRKTAKR